MKTLLFDENTVARETLLALCTGQIDYYWLEIKLGRISSEDDEHSCRWHDQKQQSVHGSKCGFELSKQNEKYFLLLNVTIDKTQIYHYTSKSEKSSSSWQQPDKVSKVVL